MNERQQERIAKMILSHTQVLSNLLLFEAEGLAFTNSMISSSNKCTLRELILDLKGLSKENKEETIFISVEKDYRGNI